jgi:recombination protein RecT
MTDTAEMKQELAKRNAPRAKQKIESLIEGIEPAIVASLGTPEGAKIVMRHYLNAIRYNDKLRECTTESLAAACLLSAQLRLEPGPLGHVYFVPYGQECVWVLGYTGIIELGRRSGATGLRATLVWDCDEYEAPWENERGLHYLLKPGEPEARQERLGVLVTWKDGERMALHCPPERIETARERSPAAKKGHGPWHGSASEIDAMWRKTGVRFARPWLPLSTDAVRGFQADNAIVSDIGIDEGEAVPVLEAEVGADA